MACRTNARGFMSGILQQGYSFGYVLAACANLGVGGSTESWKIVFWIGGKFELPYSLQHPILIPPTLILPHCLFCDWKYGYYCIRTNLRLAGLSIAIGLIRALFPDSQQFLEAKAAGKKGASPGAFWRDCKNMMAKEWKMCIYACILMTWFNYYSHTSQDSYTTFMLTQKELENTPASRASIIMKVGACVGGTIIGYVSQFVGRRRAMMVSALMSALLIPAWILPKGESSLSASGFFMQFFVQGAWGVIPIHLNELSPLAFRSSFPGVTYQIGNMISSPSAQIVNAIAEKTFVTLDNGDRVEAYGPVMGVATAIIATGIFFTVMLGPERRGREFEHVVAGVHNDPTDDKLADERLDDEEKAAVQLEDKKTATTT